MLPLFFKSTNSTTTEIDQSPFFRPLHIFLCQVNQVNSKSAHTCLRQNRENLSQLDEKDTLEKFCLHSSSQPSQPLLKLTTVFFFGPLHIFLCQVNQVNLKRPYMSQAE